MTAPPPRVEKRIDHNGPRVNGMRTPCWLWRGAHDRDGYAQTWAPDLGTRRAARAIYIWTRGPVPDGLVLDHLCRNRGCVNPRHLEPVTQKVNVHRGDLKSIRKTHCPRGHAYAGTNLVEKKLKDGRINRVCRICQNTLRRSARAAA